MCVLRLGSVCAPRVLGSCGRGGGCAPLFWSLVVWCGKVRSGRGVQVFEDFSFYPRWSFLARRRVNPALVGCFFFFLEIWS